MTNGPLERSYGRYTITFRKNDHTQGRPTPHVEVSKDGKKLANYDMASGRPIFSKDGQNTPREIREAIEAYLTDPQVVKKVTESIQSSFFDLSKPAGQYGGVPAGFKVVVTVAYTKDSLARRK